ncbi:MAG: hydantoinase B/oxoprolinase family protein [Pirellulales bacterium]
MGQQSLQSGQQSLQAGQVHTTLPAKVQLQVSAGDILTIETPGGGGYGSAEIQSNP